MKLKQNWYNAIQIRTSRRAFKKHAISQAKIEQIEDCIHTINEESGLHIQFVANGYHFLRGFKASYGLISGCPSVIAMAGNAEDQDLKRKIGYYGEFLLLECVSLGLGTCWIGGSYNREECKKSIRLGESDELVCIIAVGEVVSVKNLKELLISQIGKRKQTFDELLAEKESTPPLWVNLGIESARIAPSAVNGKPIAYCFKNNEISAFAAKKNHGSEEIDLGISMAHFQLGALQGLHNGQWVKRDNQYIFL